MAGARHGRPPCREYSVEQARGTPSAKPARRRWEPAARHGRRSSRGKRCWSVPSTAFEPSPLSWCSGEPTRAFTGSSEGTHPPGGAFPTAVAPPWTDTKVLKPAHAMSNIAVWPRGRCAPLEPPTSRAAAGAASGGCRHREPRRRCDHRAPPQRHRRSSRPRSAEHAAYRHEAAAAGGDAVADVDRAGSLRRERSRLVRLHRARPDTARTLGEHARRSGARASFGIEGGSGAPPSPAPLWVQRVCWLRTLKGS